MFVEKTLFEVCLRDKAKGSVYNCFFAAMSGGKVRSGRGLIKILALPLFCMLVMFVVVFSLNWKYLSSDMMSGTSGNSFYRDDRLKPLLSSVMSTLQSIPTSSPSFFLRKDGKDNSVLTSVQSPVNVLKSVELEKLPESMSLFNSPHSVGLAGSMDSVRGVNSVIGASGVNGEGSEGDADSANCVNNVCNANDAGLSKPDVEVNAKNNANDIDSVSEMDSSESNASNSQSDRSVSSSASNSDEFDAVLDSMSRQQKQKHSFSQHSLLESESESESDSDSESSSCQNTPLADSVSKSSLFRITDFDCSESNQGWEEAIPPPATNSTRAKRLWKKRRNLLLEFADHQNNFDLSDPNSKYIVFWPIFAGIGNNLAVFAEVMLIAMRSNRKFLVYDWDTLRSYFYLPFQFEVLTEKGASIARFSCSSVGARPRHASRGENQPVSVQPDRRVSRKGRCEVHRHALHLPHRPAAHQRAHRQSLARRPRHHGQNARGSAGNGPSRAPLPLPRGHDASALGAVADRVVPVARAVGEPLRDRDSRPDRRIGLRGHALGPIPQREGRSGVQSVRVVADALVRERRGAGNESAPRGSERTRPHRGEDEGEAAGAVVCGVGPGRAEGHVAGGVRGEGAVYAVRNEAYE